MGSVSQEEAFQFLDELKEMGLTNMLGASPYLEEYYQIDRYEAQDLLREWIQYKKNQALLMGHLGE